MHFFHLGVLRFYYECQTIHQAMAFGSSILVRFRDVHSHRSHTVAVLPSLVSPSCKKQSQVQAHTNQKGHVAHAARRAPAAAMSMSHAPLRLTRIINYKYSTLPPVYFVDKVNSYGQEGKEMRGTSKKKGEREI